MEYLAELSSTMAKLRDVIPVMYKIHLADSEDSFKINSDNTMDPLCMALGKALQIKRGPIDVQNCYVTVASQTENSHKRLWVMSNKNWFRVSRSLGHLLTAIGFTSTTFKTTKQIIYADVGVVRDALDDFHNISYSRTSEGMITSYYFENYLKERLDIIKDWLGPDCFLGPSLLQTVKQVISSIPDGAIKIELCELLLWPMVVAKELAKVTSLDITIISNTNKIHSETALAIYLNRHQIVPDCLVLSYASCYLCSMAIRHMGFTNVKTFQSLVHSIGWPIPVTLYNKEEFKKEFTEYMNRMSLSNITLKCHRTKDPYVPKTYRYYLVDYDSDLSSQYMTSDIITLIESMFH